MSATTASPSLQHTDLVDASERLTPRQRVAALLSSAGAAILGVLPHVLHDAGPLAGAALVAGVGGTLLFGAIGLVAAIPFLIRIHRRCGNWRVPAALLALFAAVFSISAFVVGPAISGTDSAGTTTKSTPGQSAPPSAVPQGHDAHH